MREHALPQDVTGYKFHLIGNMTLKQFAEVAAGFVIAFLIYQTNLLPIIKWPLMVFFAGIGAMIAFIPIEERPLDQWILAFFRALYRPTQYYWKRVPKIPEPFLFVQKSTTVSVVGEVDLSPARRQRVKEYLRSLDTTKPLDQLESFTESRLTQVMGEFQTQLTTSFAQPVPAAITEAVIQNAVDTLSFVGRASGEETNLNTDVVPSHEEQSEEVLQLFNDPNAQVTGYQIDVVPDVVAEVVPEVIQTSTAQSIYDDSPDAPIELTAELLSEETEDASIPEVSSRPLPVVDEVPTISSVFDSLPTATAPMKIEVAPPSSHNSIPAVINTVKVTELQDVSDTTFAAPRRRRLPTTKVQIKDIRQAANESAAPFIPHIIEHNDPRAAEAAPVVEQPTTPKQQHVDVVVPETEEIRVERTVASTSDAPDAIAAGIQGTSQKSEAADPALLEKTEPITKEVPTNLSAVTVNADLPFPDKPTTPNKVVGMVLDLTNNPLPNAIVEILTPTGLPARAVKTNPLGQFFITTPLNVGEYLIKAERDGFTFPTQQLVVNDKILDPIEIKAAS
jgi:hypothetical protein